MKVSGAVVCVRTITMADVDAVVALDQTTAGAPHWRRQDYDGLLASGIKDSAVQRRGLIAELGGALAGFAVVRLLRLPPDGSSSGAGLDATCELESIVVAEAVRERGVGGRLMQAVIALARSHGAGRLELEVRASNAPALVLYSRAGLQEEGRRPHYYSDPVEDALLMGIALA